ncbi:MAG: hypothetical protein O7E54_03730 [Planctomycetota bacterium]|nr:hypothetical protein [Planctomycetota bacterium]
MQTQKCSKCGTTLDVTQLEKDSKFACSNCGNVLVVGEAVAVKRSLKDGPAFKPRSGAAKQVSAPVATRAPSQSTPSSEAPRKKSPAPLIAGIAALAISAVVITVVASGGGAGGDGPGGSGTVATTPKQSPQEWWSDRVLNADGTEQDLSSKAIVQVLNEANTRGYDKDASFWTSKENLLYELLLAADPNSGKANRHLGRKSIRDYPGFKEVWNGIMTERGLPEALEKFRRKNEDRIERGGHIWYDADAFAKVTALLDEGKKYLQELEDNPYKREIEKAKARIGADPILGDYEA